MLEAAPQREIEKLRTALEDIATNCEAYGVHSKTGERASTIAARAIGQATSPTKEDVYQPKAQWIEEGDSARLMWGHVKVGEVTLGGNGTWYAYYRRGHDGFLRFESLKDFPTFDLAQQEVERALEIAAASEQQK